MRFPSLNLPLQFWPVPPDCITASNVLDAAIPNQYPCPRRFDLSYQTEAQKYEKPVMIHRAILGSVERMFAILTEHFAAKWPFWLNPRQVQSSIPGIASEDVGSQLDTAAYLPGPQPAARYSLQSKLWCQHQLVPFRRVSFVPGLKPCSGLRLPSS